MNHEPMVRDVRDRWREGRRGREKREEREGEIEREIENERNNERWREKNLRRVTENERIVVNGLESARNNDYLEIWSVRRANSKSR